MRIALFSGILKHWTIEEVIATAASIGYEGIEILVGWGAKHLEPDTPLKRVREIKRIADDHGIVFCAIYSDCGAEAHLPDHPKNKEDLKKVQRLLERAKVLGADMVKVTAGRLELPSDTPRSGGDIVEKMGRERYERGMSNLARWLAQCCEYARKLDSKIILEVHPNQYTETVDMCLDLLERVGWDNLGVLYDPANLWTAHQPFGEKDILRLRKHLLHVHLKDFKRASPDIPEAVRICGEFYVPAYLGEGEVDLLPVFKGLKEIGFGGFVSCEGGSEREPVETARRAYEGVKNMLARIGWG